MQWLLLLLCPIMMIFMMKGMHSVAKSDNDDPVFGLYFLKILSASIIVDILK